MNIMYFIKINTIHYISISDIYTIPAVFSGSLPASPFPASNNTPRIPELLNSTIKNALMNFQNNDTYKKSVDDAYEYFVNL